jgi:hypothetical protein
MSVRRWVGFSIACLGTLLLFVSLWLRLGVTGGSYWHVEKHQAVFLLLASLSSTTLLVLTIFIQLDLFFVIVAIFGAVAFGVTFFIPLGGYWSYLGAAPFLGAIGSLGIVVGAVLAWPSTIFDLLLRRDHISHSVVPDGSQPQQASAEPQQVPNQPPHPPLHESSSPVPGWYSDPAGQAALRYWDGRAWTASTQ